MAAFLARPLIAAVTGAAVLFAATTAGAQKDDAKTAYEKEVKRIAEERASRIRDLLRVVALSARKTTSISFGKVEASADGETLRIHNFVYSENTPLVPQVIRLLEISDFDRKHMLPRHLRVRGDGDVPMQALPAPLAAIFKQLNLPPLKSFSDIEYKLDEATGQFVAKTEIAWLGQARIILKAELGNFPPLNRLLELGVAGEDVGEVLRQATIKSVEVTIHSIGGADIAYRIVSLIQGGTPAQARQGLLAQIDGAIAQAPAPWMKDMGRAFKVIAEGPGTMILRLVAKNSLTFDDLQNLRGPGQIAQIADITATGKRLPADQVPVNNRPDAWKNFPSSDEANPAIHECDRVGGDPADPAKKGDGVPAASLNNPLAVVACTRAMFEFPKAGRFKYQLARALLRNGNTQGARHWLEQAAKDGHDLAKKRLGEMAK